MKKTMTLMILLLALPGIPAFSTAILDSEDHTAGGIEVSYDYSYLTTQKIHSHAVAIQGYGYHVFRGGFLLGGYGETINNGVAINLGTGGIILGYDLMLKPFTFQILSQTGFGGGRIDRTEAATPQLATAILSEEIKVNFGFPLAEFIQPTITLSTKIRGNLMGDPFQEYLSVGMGAGVRLEFFSRKL